MSVRNLESLFNPRSVAVIGASLRPQRVGTTVLRNVLAGGFKGPVYPVNPKYRSLEGHKTWPDVAALPEAPDLAIICTPPDTVPGIISALGARGTRAAIVITAGMGGASGVPGRTLRQAALDAAKPWLLRILGPNCVGMLVPGIGLNASFAHTNALPGRTALVSQSGALVTSVLDWANERGIGFSRFISMGDSADVDFGDVLDYLASDAQTDAILLYMEDVRQARKFMSAARAAARSKPTIVIKSGRAPEGAKAAASHTGALAGADQVYEAAFRRAGMLRVLSTEDLFDAAETLAHARRMGGERLAILTNGGGPGVMATDELVCSGGTLAQLSAATIAQLDRALPATWSRANPVDIIGDAPVERYVAALQALLADPQVDAVLLIHSPTAIVPSDDIAQALAPLAAASPRNVFGCWLGGAAVAGARKTWTAAGLPSYHTPEDAIGGFLQVVRYRRNQELLMQVPPAAPDAAPVARDAARALVRKVLAEGRDMLTEPEAKDLMAAYGVPIVATRSVESDEQAVAAARAIGFPVALKVLSQDISHKSDVGGVMLDLFSEEAVLAACRAIRERVAGHKPGARIDGFTVQQMVQRPEATELIVGSATDPVFGPVILFGQGGIAVEVMADRALALPPLNMAVARDLISRTRVARLLAGYRNRPPADLDAVCGVLIRVAQLVSDLAEVAEIDINPLLADSQGVIALDARVRVRQPQVAEPFDRLAIRPYPDQLERTLPWQDGQITVRPIRPEDAPAHVAFFARLTPEDIRMRMFVHMREMSPAQLARFTQIDYDREMAFIATRTGPDGEPETLGVARAITDPDNIQAEFAVAVRSDLKGRGLGRLLMETLIGYYRGRGTLEMVGDALSENSGILNLSAKLGFDRTALPQDDIVRMRLPLQESSAARA